MFDLARFWLILYLTDVCRNGHTPVSHCGHCRIFKKYLTLAGKFHVGLLHSMSFRTMLNVLRKYGSASPCGEMCLYMHCYKKYKSFYSYWIEHDIKLRILYMHREFYWKCYIRDKPKWHSEVSQEKTDHLHDWFVLEYANTKNAKWKYKTLNTKSEQSQVSVRNGQLFTLLT